MEMIDKFIDRITVYRLLIYYLSALLVVAVGLSLFGDLQYNPLYIIISATILVVSCWVINRIFAFIFDAPINPESSIITALILALIITPQLKVYDITFLLAAPGLAIASKYLITIRKKHIFNPAAIAVLLTMFGPRQSASWWVGTAAMLPFVIIGGILIARKARRGRMVTTFFIATTLATVLYSILDKANIDTNLYSMLLSSPIFFLGFVMLVEPLTSPGNAKNQTWYAILVGALLPPQANIFSFYSSPELALIVGNIFSYIVSPKIKLFPTLKEKLEVATNTMDFVFASGQKLIYKPGQYMEFTFQHDNPDSRGSRRYFTLASSPTEEDLRIGIKFYDEGSSFKHAMLEMDSDASIVASQLTGDFVLPKSPHQKLAFIAGGIGITPFRSMVKFLIDTGEKRAITLLYSARSETDIAYREVFEEARQTVGVNTFYGITDLAAEVSGAYSFRGSITADIIAQAIPDFKERIFYISGTHSMVISMRDLLFRLGVPRKNIKVDFFPGYV